MNHPRACLRLLPVIAGAAQGRLDTSLILGSGGAPPGGYGSTTGSLPWGKFVARHHIDFYSGLLAFIEVLAFLKDSEEATCGTLFSPEAAQYR